VRSGNSGKYWTTESIVAFNNVIILHAQFLDKNVHCTTTTTWPESVVNWEIDGQRQPHIVELSRLKYFHVLQIQHMVR
jgi:hypothetical protein